MGKASKWFRGLLGLKKSDQQLETTAGKPSKDKRSWSFVKSYREKDSRSNQSHGGSVKHRDQSTTTTRRDIAVRSIDSAERVDPDKHAIAVAAATAAVAEAAVVAAHAAAAAAAHAAAAAVRLTNSGRCGNGSGHDSVVNNQIREVWAAVKIQAAFRGCLARKALRALKGLVRLQALVRGHIERKRTSEWLLRMQAILRAQARARAGRAQMSELSQSSSKSSHFHPPGPATPEKFEHDVRTKSLKFDQPSMLRRNCSRSNYRAIVDQGEAQLLWHQSDGLDPRVNGDSQRDKILDMDMAKANRKTLFRPSKQALSFDQHSHSFTTSKESNHQTPQYSSSCEVQSLTPLKFSYEAEEGSFCTAENSPQFHSASSKGANVKRSPFTPTKSDGSSYLSGYSDYPNYMCFTESSRAKIRSLSAPRQRPQYERSLWTKRSSAQSNGNHSAQKVNLHANFTSKAYPGSGRLDGLGMPVMPVGHRY